MSMKFNPARPPKCMPNVYAYPIEIRGLKRYVLWRWKAESNPDGTFRKWGKCPCNRLGSNISIKNEANHLTLDAVVKLCESDDNIAGIGFVLGDGIAGGDIDNCIDPATGVWNPEALKLLRLLGATYIETSPSGEGVKFLFKYDGAPPKGYAKKLKSHGLDLELYFDKRFFTLTGNAVDQDGKPENYDFARNDKPLQSDRNVIHKLLDEYFKKPTSIVDLPTPGNIAIEFELVSASVAIDQFEDADDYKLWIDIGMSLSSASKDIAWFELWDRYSKLSKKYPGREALLKLWNGFKPPGEGGITLDTLHYLAKEANPAYVRLGTVAKLSNYKWVQEGEDSWQEALGLPEIGERLKQLPIAFINVRGEIYARVADGPLVQVSTATAFQAKLWSVAQLEWTTKLDQHVSMGVLFEWVKNEYAKKYDEISASPTFPPNPTTYYLYPAPEPKQTGELERVLSLFKPSDEFSKGMIRALLLTMLWGGNPGGRPLFIIQSSAQGNDGIASGKSHTAESISYIAARGNPGHLVLNATKPKGMDDFVTGWLKPRMYRINSALEDNVKGGYGGQALESAITSRTIQGHQMYEGHGVAPNFLTWIMTSNGGWLTKDIISRSAPIKIDPAGTFDPSRAEKYDAIDYDALFADVAYIFAQEPVAVDPSLYTRMPAWCREVVCRCPNPEYLLSELKRRNAEAVADNDGDDAAEVRALIQQEIHTCSIDAVSAKVHLPVETVRRILAEQKYDGKLWTGGNVRQLLNRLVGNAAFPELQVSSNNNYRGYLWVGTKATSRTSIAKLQYVFPEESTAMA